MRLPSGRPTWPRVGAGVVTVALLAVLWLFADLMVWRGRVPDSQELSPLQERKLAAFWNALTPEERAALLSCTGTGRQHRQEALRSANRLRRPPARAGRGGLARVRLGLGSTQASASARPRRVLRRPTRPARLRARPRRSRHPQPRGAAAGRQPAAVDAHPVAGAVEPLDVGRRRTAGFRPTSWG